MTPSGIDPTTFRFVAQPLNHCSTAVPLMEHKITLIYNMNEEDYKPDEDTSACFVKCYFTLMAPTLMLFDLPGITYMTKIK
jgi:hypothetical protein